MFEVLKNLLICPDGDPARAALRALLRELDGHPLTWGRESSLQLRNVVSGLLHGLLAGVRDKLRGSGHICTVQTDCRLLSHQVLSYPRASPAAKPLIDKMLGFVSIDDYLGRRSELRLRLAALPDPEAPKAALLTMLESLLFNAYIPEALRVSGRGWEYRRIWELWQDMDRLPYCALPICLYFLDYSDGAFRFLLPGALSEKSLVEDLYHCARTLADTAPELLYLELDQLGGRLENLVVDKADHAEGLDPQEYLALMELRGAFQGGKLCAGNFWTRKSFERCGLILGNRKQMTQ